MNQKKIRTMIAKTFVAFALAASSQPANAGESYTALSRAVVLATVSPDLLGGTKLDPKPFAKCFRAQGLTEKELKATIKAGTPGPRVTRCLDKLIGL
jgi:hypothetical protein